MNVLLDGAYKFHAPLDVPGEVETYFTFASGWLIEVIRLSAGDYTFRSDGQIVRADSRTFGVYYPAFTIVRATAREVCGLVHGIGSTEAIPELPKEPMIFATDRERPFAGLQDALDTFAVAGDKRPICLNTRPSLLTIRTKKLIDQTYRAQSSISEIARRLGVSHAHLSRQFKRDYGISPSVYLHQLRVAEATFRLSLGETILDISGDVGYNDLSRFYKQFRKSTGSSPAICRDTL